MQTGDQDTLKLFLQLEVKFSYTLEEKGSDMNCNEERNPKLARKEETLKILSTISCEEVLTEKKGRVSHSCRHCEQSFNTFIHLKVHIRNRHTENYEDFLESAGLLKPFNCEICNEKFRSIFRLRKHIKGHHSESVWLQFVAKCQIIECGKCEQKFFSKVELRTHGRKVHQDFRTPLLSDGKHAQRKPATGIEERTCSTCSKVCRSVAALKDHCSTQHEGEGLQCEQCDYRSSSRRALSSHITLHNEHEMLCGVCGETCSSEWLLKTHKKEKHQSRRGEVRNCGQCGQLFRDSKALKGHLKVVHVEEEKKFPCSFCSHKARSKHQLLVHESLHLPATLPCPNCGSLHHTQHYLDRHIRTVHGGEGGKVHQCGQCGKGFMTRY